MTAIMITKTTTTAVEIATIVAVDIEDEEPFAALAEVDPWVSVGPTEGVVDGDNEIISTG